MAAASDTTTAASATTTAASDTTTGTSDTIVTRTGVSTLARRALSWLPVALLLGLAATHVALVRCCRLHPWLGGGFGMFSTVDERRLLAFALTAEGARALELPEALEDAAERAEALPSEARLRQIADVLASDAALGAAAVRVEVWETRFGPAMEPRRERLRSLEREVASVRP